MAGPLPAPYEWSLLTNRRDDPPPLPLALGIESTLPALGKPDPNAPLFPESWTKEAAWKISCAFRRFRNWLSGVIELGLPTLLLLVLFVLYPVAFMAILLLLILLLSVNIVVVARR